MEKCPKCNGPLQLFSHVDVDDICVGQVVKCKRQYLHKNKKGCGFNKNLKKEEWKK